MRINITGKNTWRGTNLVLIRKAGNYTSTPSSSAPSPGGGGAYIGTGDGHWIESNSADGSVIVLEDGSRWSILSVDQIGTALWLPVDSITVTEGGIAPYSYVLVNTDENGEKAWAEFLGYS